MEKTVLIETSARHVHVTKEALAVLFCEERIAVIGPKGQFPAVSILGPVRPANQVEISASDARAIGVAAVVRESGDIAGTPGCKLVGPKGEIEISEGVIVAKRHIHMTPEDAANYGLSDKQIVSVKIPSNGRELIFGDVVVRVSEKFKLAMHIDTDESNAALPISVLSLSENKHYRLAAERLGLFFLLAFAEKYVFCAISVRQNIYNGEKKNTQQIPSQKRQAEQRIFYLIFFRKLGAFGKYLYGV